jgi:glycosyltransferase involved in cell wall biosynthesis
MPRIVLISMVRNESAILRRCLESVEGVVDAFCIHDTGSTDSTVQIATDFLRTRPGCLTHSVWKDFGTNRTQSFVEAKAFVRDVAKWDLKDTYGLLLDADMVFQPGTLKSHPLTEIGYSVTQVAGHLAYPNCRLVRMDHEWVCRGVTHEYWDGPTSGLPRSVCWIDDRNDGGCKSDKFERDARLLEKGLEDDPTNVRYMFYLAQTYHSLGRWKDCIDMYKKRFDAGGWDEERWYSLYMIAQAYLQLNEPIKFESWMLRARAHRPTRAESVYKLAKYFREKGEHYKAYQYVKMGKDIPLTTDALFIEMPVYTGLFDYEETILLYYLQRHQEGLAESMKYLLTKTEHLDNVYRNMGFYIKPIGTSFQTHPIHRDLAGLDYHPSSVSFFTYNDRLYHNVRFVNYSIDQRNGSYFMKEGSWSTEHAVRTQNAVWNGKTGFLLKDDSVSLPRIAGSRIRGLEDLRVAPDASGVLRFYATQREYTDKNRILTGIYDLKTQGYRECKVLEPPTDTACEKNWLPIPGTDDILYAWSPLQIGRVKGSRLEITKTIPTSWIFQHLRGSAVPFRVGSDYWTVVHFVEHGSPRKYFHALVILNGETYSPHSLSMPFTFKATGIEYCLGARATPEGIEFAFSSWDDTPYLTTVPVESFAWLQL